MTRPSPLLFHASRRGPAALWVLPAGPSVSAGLGCGTGSIGLLSADLGHSGIGAGFSTQMRAVARSKASGRDDVTFGTGDVSRPDLPEAGYDIVLCRHVLWALPEPLRALRRRSRMLREGGRLVLIEGLSSSGVGPSSERTAELLREGGVRRHRRASWRWGPVGRTDL